MLALLLSSVQALHPALNGPSIVTREPPLAAAGRPREIALTFDADMTPGMEGELRSGKVRSFDNEALVRVLDQTNTPATFFLTGRWAQVYPASA